MKSIITIYDPKQDVFPIEDIITYKFTHEQYKEGHANGFSSDIYNLVCESYPDNDWTDIVVDSAQYSDDRDVLQIDLSVYSD